MGLDVFSDTPLVSITGPVTITKDPKDGSAGSISLTGGATISGGITADTVQGGVVSPTISTGGTIQVTGARVIKATVAASAQASNLTIASGLSGQELAIINENTTGTSTIIITGSVIAALGTTTVTISGGAGAKFIFDSTQQLWVKL
jgi:hypothetical protein